MKPGKLTKYLLAVPALLLGACVLFSVPASAGKAGLTAAAFLKFDPDPRATGMGEACTAATQDAYSTWWNPAGLAGLEVPQLSATQNTSFAGVTNQFAAVAYPLNYGSTLGLSVVRQSMETFQGYDASGDVTRELQASDSAIAASYARTLLKDEIERPFFNAGLTVKSISETLDKASTNALAVDLGAIYFIRPSKYWMRNVPAQEVRVALAVRNLGSAIKFDKLAFALPQSTTLGLAWITHPSGAHTLTLTADMTSSNYADLTFNAGAEYCMFQLFCPRGGFVSGQTSGSGLRMGVGFHLSFVDLDYSASPFGELGRMQKLGATVRFGAPAARQPLTGATARVAKAKLMAPKAKIEALKVYANDYIELARKNMDAREYTIAVDNFGKAFNLEPGLKKGLWGEKAERLNTLAVRLKLKDTPVREKTLQKTDEQSTTAHEAVAAYVEGHELKAFLLAHAALGANPRGDALFEELLYNLADLTHDSVRRDEIIPKVALVKEKLKKAAKSFYIQQFDLAAAECEEVVLIDETNLMGWTRLGSAYYMMGDKAKARKAYEKVMELNPGDTMTRQFMDAQGWK